MPYITTEARNRILQEENALGYPIPQSAGELNYCITNLVTAYFQGLKNYQGINDIVGALEGAKLEFYARVVRPYEDAKIKANGDVY